MSFPDTIKLSAEEIARTGTTQVCPLGTRGETPDGRVFRYIKAYGTISRGRLVQMEAPNVVLSVPQTSNLCLATEYGTTIGTTWNSLALAMSKYIDATAMAANNFKEGFVYVGGTGHPTGSGQCFKIKSHTALTASSTAYAVFTFEDDVHPEASFTTDVAIGICKNSYDDVIQVAAGAEPTAPVVGMAVCTFASGDYGWVQTWGKGVAYVAGATTARAPLIGSTDANTTGLMVGTSGTSLALNQFVAISPCVIVAGAYAPVELRISP